MANTCETTYKITGSRKAVNDLWVTLQKMEVNRKKIWLDELAKYYGIDYEKKHISVRGNIFFADLIEDEENDHPILTIETDTAWTGCHELFRVIGAVLWNELVINYREIEPGCEIYCIHDEEGFFPEECCVCSSGEPFRDAWSDIFRTVGEAIDEWCIKTGNQRNGRSDEEMIDYINDFKYEDEDSYFQIYRFTQE